MKSAENGVVLVWSTQQVKNAICVFDDYGTYNNKPLRDTRERNNVTRDIPNLSNAPSPEGGGKAIYFRGTVDVSRKSNTFDPPLRLFP